MKIASLREELIYNEAKVSIKVMMETETSKEIRILFVLAMLSSYLNRNRLTHYHPPEIRHSSASIILIKSSN